MCNIFINAIYSHIRCTFPFLSKNDSIIAHVTSGRKFYIFFTVHSYMFFITVMCGMCVFMRLCAHMDQHWMRTSHGDITHIFNPCEARIDLLYAHFNLKSICAMFSKYICICTYIYIYIYMNMFIYTYNDLYTSIFRSVVYKHINELLYLNIYIYMNTHI